MLTDCATTSSVTRPRYDTSKRLYTVSVVTIGWIGVGLPTVTVANFGGLDVHNLTQSRTFVDSEELTSWSRSSTTMKRPPLCVHTYDNQHKLQTGFEPSTQQDY